MNESTIAPDQLRRALTWRYATKVFDPGRKISPALWDNLETALVLSASSFGLQPYRFLVIDDPRLREQLRPHAWDQRQVVDASHFLVFAARTTVTEPEIDQFIQLIATTRGVPVQSLAPYRSMMTGSLLTDNPGLSASHWSARQVYLALGNLLTSAALLGIDACPIEGFVPAEFDRILGLPEQGLAAVVCCALGYRSADDKHATLPKVRFPAAHLIRHV